MSHILQMHKASANPGVFTLSIQGSGNLVSPFHQALMARHPNATVYDREQETEWQKPSPFLPPVHPEVSDIDVFFRLSGPCDQITLRCRGRHRFFSFDPNFPGNDEARLDRFLQSVVAAVDQLLREPGVEVPELPLESEAATELPEPSPETY